MASPDHYFSYYLIIMKFKLEKHFLCVCVQVAQKKAEKNTCYSNTTFYQSTNWRAALTKQEISMAILS